MDYTGLLDFVEIAVGLYVIYLAYVMKKTGKLTNNALISKNLDLSKAPDPQGYINATFIPDIISGVVLVLCGIASRATYGTSFYDDMQVITMVASLIIIFAFGFTIIRSQKKYLEGK